jgi:hypothetical protein
MINLQANYFRLQESAEVHSSIKATLTKEEYDALIGEQGIKKHDNTGKILMIFNDESGSMSG